MPFSVIIPTMQRSPMLWPFVEQLCSTNDVDEVLIINNAPARLTFVNRKVRVLDQPQNLYVNPSWNLGVSFARSKYICIANDDLAFDMQLFRRASYLLRLPVGILAPAPECFVDVERGLLTGNNAASGRFHARPVYRRTEGFGTLMFMRRSAYRPIPSDLRIWFGDDYLFHQQERRNLLFRGTAISTPMSSTSSDPSFNPIFWEDRTRYMEMEPGRYEERFGREPATARRLVGAARSILRR